MIVTTVTTAPPSIPKAPPVSQSGPFQPSAKSHPLTASPSPGLTRKFHAKCSVITTQRLPVRSNTRPNNLLAAKTFTISSTAP